MRARIEVGALVEAGLAGQPECVIGVGFRRPAVAVLCRRHVTGDAVIELGASAGDEAVLLIGGTVQARGLSRWCALCRRPAPAAGPVRRDLVMAGGDGRDRR